jgi:DNA-binding response OmpR family regulator
MIKFATHDFNWRIRPEKVLVVAVDEHTAGVIQDLLRTRFPESETVIAPNVMAGLQLVRTDEFDLVVAGIFILNLNGLRFLRGLQKLPQYADVPKLVLSGSASRQAHVLAYRCGASYCMLKPVDWHEFLLVLEDVLAAYNIEIDK